MAKKKEPKWVWVYDEKLGHKKRVYRKPGSKSGMKPVDTSPQGQGYANYDEFIPKRIVPYKAGVPTLYKPEYDELLIQHMGEGFSFQSFASKLSCAASTLYQWVEAYESFAEAKRIGFDLSRQFWEALARKNATFNSGSTAGIKFNMINRFRGEWTESSNVDVTTKGEKVNATTINLDGVSEETLRELLKTFKPESD